MILLMILLSVAGACTCMQVTAAGLGSHTRLSLQLNKAKKSVSSDDSYIKRANCVGAVGYAVVLPDERVPPNDFFRTDIRFRVRLRCVATRHVHWFTLAMCTLLMLVLFHVGPYDLRDRTHDRELIQKELD